ncbi:MAG: thioredoxin family protein [Bacteroidales bacterium]|nr:thioredoxin family protein [Bacteroidales bacterium]
MNRKLSLLFFVAAIFSLAWPAAGQIDQPVKWDVSAQKVDDNVYEIKATGQMGAGWHIYDLQDYPDGPNPTVFSVSGNAVEPVGEPQIISDTVREYDNIFEMEIGTCEGHVVIVQQVRTLQGGKCKADVHIEWQACNTGTCYPPDEYDTTLELKGTAPGDRTGSLWGLILEAILWGLLMLLTPCVFPMVPMTVSFFLKQSGNVAAGRFKAVMYGLFIVLLYTIPISIIIGLTWAIGGSAVTADIFNWLSTHWLPNILFFIIFMVFAASFFGAFEIVLPSKWTNSADKNSDKGGLAGVFFLALTLVLVSFSCTGPIVGTVLIKSTQGEFWTPMVTMLAFSIAFALPFALLAFFPSVLKKLPKSGGWLNSVKVVLGFIEVALGLKFLSVADQTYHWHLLDREVYLAIWIVCFTLLGLYLMGKIRFKYDTPLEHISVGRLVLIIIDFSFVVWMLPGMWGAPLKALSGYLPPLQTQDFVLGSPIRSGMTGTATATGAGTATGTGTADGGTYIVDGENTYVIAGSDQQSLPVYGSEVSLPHGLSGYSKLEDGIAAAAASGKKVFVDITGHGCVNCREMEARVWSDPEVLQRLRDNFVIVSLYVDDKARLPEDQWVTTPEGKVLKDVGRVNSKMVLDRFGVNSQPNYFILDGQGNVLAGPRGYNLDTDAFVKFLDL